MTDRTPQENLEALSETYAAARRLSTHGLATNVDGNRGLTDDGLQTLADLLAVLMVQTQSGQSRAEQVAGVTARAMLSAVGDLYAELADTPSDGTDTLRLLGEAARTARG